MAVRVKTNELSNPAGPDVVLPWFYACVSLITDSEILHSVIDRLKVRVIYKFLFLLKNTLQSDLRLLNHCEIMSHFQHITNGEVSQEDSRAHGAKEAVVPATAM